MTSVRSLLLAALVVLGFAGPSAAQAPWQTMSPADRSFFADMPGAPKYSSEKMKAGSGDEYTMHTYILEAGGEAYVVHTAMYPPSISTSNPRSNLQASLDNAAGGMKGKAWESVNWTTVQGLLAVDAVGERSGFAIRIRTLLDGQRIVALTYAGPPGSATSSNAARFLSSLRLAR